VAIPRKLADNRRMRNKAIKYSSIDSPVGPLVVAGGDDMLVAVRFATERRMRRPLPDWQEDDGAFTETRRQIGEFFAGERIEFSLPYRFAGDDFQQAVWQAMCAIPYGETRTYGEIARKIGETTAASRAVGAACGENPLPIVVPCHRVVGSGGALTGFGGGVAIKRFLLDLEFRVRPPADTLFAMRHS
jgi:methylated-DNA-[protein]-cysteine S-methyltransferase